MSDLDAYVERVITDGYKQAINDEENLTRSLPFFATALAVLAAIMGSVRDVVPGFSLSLYPMGVWVLMTLLGISVARCLLCLWRAATWRTFQYPMSEQDFLKHSDELREHYQGTLPSDQDCNATVLRELRKDMLAQMSVAASTSRNINNRRLGLRSKAATALIEGLVFAFLLGTTIVVNKGFTGAAQTATTTKSNVRKPPYQSAEPPPPRAPVK